MEPQPNPRSLTWRILACLLLVATLLWVVAGHTNADDKPQPEVAYVNGGNIHWTGLQNVTNDRRRDIRPALSPDGRTIAFVRRFESDRTESEIVRINVDGSGLQRLTHNYLLESWPTWSPDGTRLAFSAGDLYVLPVSAAGGGTPARLTAGDLNPWNIAWSPDGTRLAFNSSYCLDDHACDNWNGSELYVVRLADAHLTRLTNNDVYDGHPTWSPDGAQLAYETWSPVEANFNINLIAAAGGPDTPLVTAGPNIDPAWSPDGRRIAFSSQRSFDYNIHVVDADGGNRRALTTHLGNDWNPSWSSDDQIAFTSNRDGNWELYVMNADSSDQRNLTHTPAVAENDAAWSPSGDRLAFARQENGNWDIYVMNGDGSGLTRLTNHVAADRNPTWSPNGARIAFESNRNGMDSIYILTVEGTPGNEVVWSRRADHEREPSWSADGTKLAFGVVSGYGNPQIESLMWAPVADSSSRHEIAASLSLHTQPAFRPVTYDVTPRVWVPMVRR